jgi:signal transduction histidine kinase
MTAARGKMTPMEQRGQWVDRVTAASWVVITVLAILATTATIVVWRHLAPGDSYFSLITALAAIVYATLGFLIVRRARNLIGWVLLGVGFGLAYISFAGVYAVFALVSHPGALPLPKFVGVSGQWVFVATNLALGLLLFVFPTGSLPSPRWRPVVIAGVVSGTLTTIGFVINPVTYGIPAPGGVALRLRNPAGISSSATSNLLVVSTWVVVLAIVAAFVSLVIRYRSGDREQRLQIKWVAFAAASALLCLLAALLSLIVCSCDQSNIATAFQILVGAIVLFGVPSALAVAILKHRLYDIDVIINRAVVYGLLAAAFTALYLLVVVGIGSLIGYGIGNPLLTTIAAVAIALLFQPLRRRAQRVANRVVYGDRATPYEVLSDFAERMAGTSGIDDVLDRMATILAQGTGATRVEVWLRVGGELRPVATWPAEATMPDPIALGRRGELPAFEGASRAIPVRHRDELLGALVLQKPRNEPLSPTEDKLLQDLASQAGLVLRNVRLAAELQATIEQLRASRRRLVEAQDEERRKIERNLHDGAQQQLVALTVQLGLLGRAAEDPERVRAMAEQLRGGLQDALDDLRNLARGIYPPLLADKGLPAALEAQGRKATVETRIEPDGIGRYPREVEAAVYFCALEAMQNVAKYAAARSTVVRLSDRDGVLTFEIKDDGRGFDPDMTTYGTGVQGMADRMDAIGGRLDVRSSPGGGTLVRGTIRLTGTEVTDDP